MWVFLSNSFLSIVDKGGDGSTLLVRARKPEDIEKVFPEARVVTGKGTDYRYRARIAKDLVAARLAEEVRNIIYSNFKATVTDHDRHRAYMEVWQTMHSYQENS